MRHLGGCSECFTVWWACACPNHCEECGAGYRSDGNSNCGTPGCRTGARRHWQMQDHWAQEAEEALTETPSIQCEAVDPAAEHEAWCFAEAERQGEERRAAGEHPQGAMPTAEPVLEPETVTASRPGVRRRAGVQNGRATQAASPVHAEPDPLTLEPEHRPVAQRRAEVIALLDEGLSNREIARRVKVSPSTVAAVRMAEVDASRA